MPTFVDISMLGDKALQRALKRLPIVVERKIVRQAIRKGAKILQAAATANIPRVTGRHTDLLRDVGIKIKAIKRSRGRFGVLIMSPTREELDIPADDKYYWPAVIEFGSPTSPAYAYERRAKEEKQGEVLALAARVIAGGIIREAAKK